MVQQSWRSGKQAPWLLQRRLLRLYAAALVSALLIWLLILLAAPFRQPQAHLVVLAAASRNPLDKALLDYLPQDVNSLETTVQRLERRGAATGPLARNDLDSRDALQNFTAHLQQAGATRRDALVLVLYVCGTAVVEGSETQILYGDGDATRPDRERVTLRTLLGQVSDCQAAQRFLILDLGRTDYDPRLGSLANIHPALLQDEIAATRDKRLWVLTSNAAFERSHVAWSLERSVFSYFVTRGLNGAADLDADQQVAVDELYRYVAAHVAAMVRARTDGSASQTPQLFWGGGPLSLVEKYPLLVTVGPRARAATAPPSEERQALAGAIAASQQTSRLAASYGLLYIPTASQLAHSATARFLPFRMPGGPAGMILRDAAAQVSANAPELPQAAVPQAATPSAPDTQATVTEQESAPAQGGASAGGGTDDAQSSPAKPPGLETAESAAARSQDAAAHTSTAAPAAGVQQAAERRVAMLLSEAWQLRDRLAARVADQPVPRDFAPHLWRELQQQLMSLERRFRAGSIAGSTFHEDLREFMASLRQLANGERVAWGGPQTVAARIDQLRFTAWPDGNATRSLGLATNLAAWSGQPLSPVLDSLTKALDRFVTGGTSAEFEKWANSELPGEALAFREVWLAKRLANEPAVTWADKQLALLVARSGEQAAADCLNCLPWVRDEISMADRSRLEGERALFDRIGPDWLQDARARLTEAESLYRAAAADAETVVAAQYACNALAERSLAYVYWQGMVEQTQTLVDSRTDLLARLLQTLADMFALIEQPGSTRPERLVQLRRQLEYLQTEIESGWNAEAMLARTEVPGQVRRMESFLATALPAAETRLQLLAALPRLEGTRLATMSFLDPSGPALTPAPASHGRWQRLVAQSRLELALARVAVFRTASGRAPGAADCPDLSRLNAACQELERAVEGAAPGIESIQAAADVEAALRDFYRELPKWIRRAAARAEDLRDLATRPQRLQELRAALRGLRYVDPRDANALEGINPHGTLVLDALYDHFVWQRERLLLARADAPAIETDYLTGAAEAYRELATRIGGRPRLAPLAPGSVAIDGPSAVSLAPGEQNPVDFSFRNIGSHPLAMWLVVQYDPEELQLAVPTGQAIYAQHELTANPRQEPGFQSTAELLPRHSGADWPKSRFTIRGKTLTNASLHQSIVGLPPLAPPEYRGGMSGASPPEYRGGMKRSVACLLPLYSGGARGGSWTTAVVSTNREKRFRAGSGYPPRPDTLSQPRTLDLPPGEAVRLSLRVQQSRPSAQPPAFIVKAIACVDGELIEYVRHRVDVELPTREPIELQIFARPGLWSDTDGSLVLHPFPNRSTTFQFRLRNLTPQDRSVEVLILGSDRSPPAEFPRGALAAADAVRILERFEPTRVLVSRFSTLLPRGGQPVVVAPPPPDAAKGSAQDGAEKQATNQPTVAASGGQESPADPLPNTLLCVVTDANSGRQIIRQIRCEVQRPRRFLRPRVGYDPVRERIDVRIGPIDPELLPDGTVQVEVESIGAVPPGTQFRLKAEITPQQPEVHLYTNMPAARGRVVSLQLHVDGYPRAFTYDVSCWELADDIPEQTHRMDVRITGLPGGAVYLAPAAKIPVQVEVDAPAGSFVDGDDMLLVGIDQDRDRELIDDPCLTLHTDRQVRLFLQEIAPDGTWTVRSEAGDFLLDLPTATTRSGRMSALAQLSVASKTVWSEPQPLVLDGLPPRVIQPRLKPGADVPLGGELEVSVLASDDDLSGVAKVETAFDLQQTGKFAEEPKPVEAKQDATTGAWVAKLPTAGLSAGAYRLLLRATDRVGNEGNYETLSVRILSADESASAAVSQVSGTVLYGQQPIAGAELTLTAEKIAIPAVKSNDQGVFLFPKVPPGKYQLTARGLVHNKYRNAEAEIDVGVPPALAIVRELKLQ